MTENSKKKTDRPQCPDCNSAHVLSRGIDWTCADCGRNWRKKYRIPKYLNSPDATVYDSNKVVDV